MEVMEAIRKRYSCRSYLADPVPSEILMQLVDAGRLAPSGLLEQPWKFVVITDVSTLRELSSLTDYGKHIGKAAACIAVFCKAEAKYAVEDGAAATENILLAATGMGLGSCWVAGDKKPYSQAVATLLRAPAEFKLISLIGLGYPNDSLPADRERLPLEEVLYWQNFIQD